MSSTHPPTVEGSRHWSDNSRAGAPALPAATKKLAGLLYNEQIFTVGQTSPSTGVPGTSMDIPSRYLAFKHLSASMKTAILKQSHTRAVSEDQSRAVVDSLSVQPGLAQELLESPHAEIRQWTSELLGHLASHGSAVDDMRSLKNPERHQWHNVPQMQPPAHRPQTSQSVHSWWSDSRSIGATISIHAVAKPLMRLMYHRQAMNFIRKNLGTPLSAHIMDVYSRYLAYKYISLTTKTAILRDLENRTVFEDDAHLMNDSLAVQSDLVEALLKSPFTEIRRSACKIFGQLTLRVSRLELLLVDISCLVYLLSDEHLTTVDTAIEALSSFLDFPKWDRVS
ncbi:hypothetical protein B0H13DRAFT_2361410 [Mycena leptocephala]|nr:hypothetical protein B0H13DRAFT_2361410 [Mycena leptocephala]